MEEKTEPGIKVVKIDSAEKWTTNTALTPVKIDSIHGMIEFNVNGLTAEQFVKIEELYSMPEVPIIEKNGLRIPDRDDSAYQEAYALATYKRYVHAIDLRCLPVPGDSIEEKVQWASDNLCSKDEVKQMYNQILSASGFKRPDKVASQGIPKIITDIKDWSSLSRKAITLHFIRENEIMAFDLRPMTRIVSSQIEKSCVAPEPPMIPVPGKPIRLKQFVKDESNPVYLEKIGVNNWRRRVLTIEASVDWKFPGESMDEKINWLKLRPAGEVLQIYREILDTVNNFQSRSDFF